MTHWFLYYLLHCVAHTHTHSQLYIHSCSTIYQKNVRKQQHIEVCCVSANAHCTSTSYAIEMHLQIKYYFIISFFFFFFAFCSGSSSWNYDVYFIVNVCTCIMFAIYFIICTLLKTLLLILLPRFPCTFLFGVTHHLWTLKCAQQNWRKGSHQRMI